MLCQFERLVYPKTVQAVTPSSYMVALYRPCEKLIGAARTPLTLAESFDNGATWETIFILEDQPGEYSYPSLIYAEGTLYVSYTWNRESIVCREFKVN